MRRLFLLLLLMAACASEEFVIPLQPEYAPEPARSAAPVRPVHVPGPSPTDPTKLSLDAADDVFLALELTLDVFER
ncbi:hypothetical protein CMO91_03420 [Candidatus Woesearchaeota archaeon]|jgi:hypothetical protein|nr:hypothetical protein [Candidatus Woesearchaeota archaeon]